MTPIEVAHDLPRLCVLPPSGAEGGRACAKLLRLLEADQARLPVVLVDRGGAASTHGARTIAGIHELEPAQPSRPDLFVCWELSDLAEILAGARMAAVVYGVTLENLVPGSLPAHSAILGYLVDGPFARGILTCCGIPLRQQFELGPLPDDGEIPPPSAARPSSGGQGVLVVGDARDFLASVKSACGVLGLRLERWSAAAAAGISVTALARYDCVIATGPLAVRAAAAGVAVIVADERGAAGLLSARNLRAIFDAGAGPGCLDRPAGPEFFLAALRNVPRANPLELAAEIRREYGREARAARLREWLRQRPAGGASATAEEPASRLRLLSVAGMAALPMATGPSGPAAVELAAGQEPSGELLVAAGGFAPVAETRRPLLPLDREIAANDRLLRDGFFQQGWSVPEPWGRWTDAAEAGLEMELPATPEGRELELALTLQTFLPPGRLFQRVTVCVNGEILLCWRIDRAACNTPHILPLPTDQLAGGGICRVTFHLPDIDSPGSWGMGDSRRLGVGLSRIRLSERAG